MQTRGRLVKLFSGSPVLADYSKGRDNNFNLIRMLAAFGVMVSHAYPLSLGPGTPEPFEVFLKGDNLGRASVFVFFAISGFFITKSVSYRSSIGAFLLARALRLFPALIVMTIVVSLAGVFGFRRQKTIGRQFQAILSQLFQCRACSLILAAYFQDFFRTILFQMSSMGRCGHFDLRFFAISESHLQEFLE